MSGSIPLLEVRPGLEHRGTTSTSAPTDLNDCLDSWFVLRFVAGGRCKSRQSNLQRALGSMQQHSHVIDGDAQLFGNLFVAHLFEISQTTDFGLIRWQRGERRS